MNKSAELIFNFLVEKFRGVNNTVGTEKVILDGLDHGFADKSKSTLTKFLLRC